MAGTVRAEPRTAIESRQLNRSVRHSESSVEIQCGILAARPLIGPNCGHLLVGITSSVVLELLIHFVELYRIHFAF